MWPWGPGLPGHGCAVGTVSGKVGEGEQGAAGRRKCARGGQGVRGAGQTLALMCCVTAPLFLKSAGEVLGKCLKAVGRCSPSCTLRRGHCTRPGEARLPSSLFHLAVGSHGGFFSTRRSGSAFIRLSCGPPLVYLKTRYGGLVSASPQCFV